MTLEEAVALIPDRVARGVKFLETTKRRPNWAAELKQSLESDDPNNDYDESRPGLKMNNCHLCVCGRLFGDYFNVAREGGPSNGKGISQKTATECGFFVVPFAADEEDEAYHDALAAEWLRVMNEKLQEAAP